MGEIMGRHQRGKFRINLEYILFLVLYKLIRGISLHTAYLLSAQLFHLLYLGYPKYRRRAISHLLHAGVAKTPQETGRIARRSYQEFSRLLVEIVKCDQEFRLDKIRLVGDPETVARLQKDPRQDLPNVILVTAHYGNWELAGPAFAAVTRRPMVSIMRPFSNPKVGELILGHRRGKDHELVPKGPAGLRQLMRAIHDRKIVTILIDQHASESEGVETTFFGQLCRTHKTPALLHLKTGLPIMPEITRRVNENFEFELTVGPLIQYQPTGDPEADVRNIMQRCNDELQKMIVARQPEQWLWSHRRWLNINRKTPHHAA